MRDGFQAVMPTFQGKLNEDKIDWLIACLKTFSSHTPPNELELANLVPPLEDEESEGDVPTEETDDSTGTVPEGTGGGDS